MADELPSNCRKNGHETIEINNMEHSYGVRIGLIFQVTISIITAVIVSFIYSWKLALVCTVSTPLILLATIALTKLTATTQHDDGKLAKVATEAISSIRTIASIGKEEAFHSTYINSLNYNQRKMKRQIIATLLRGAGFGLGNNAALLLSSVSIFYGAYLIENEGLHFKSMFVINEALLFGMELVGQSLALTPNFESAKIAARRVFNLLDQTKKHRRKSSSHQQISGVLKGKIEFDNVYFSYPSRPDLDVLRGLTATVLHPDKTVALVGPSGCGKSTCIQLIQRFYKQKTGTIQLDGNSLDSVPLETLRRNIGIVSQEPVLFNRTLRENIAYGIDNATMAEVIEAAKQANIHSFIQSLPMGYETNVGQKGAQLSGGQKQRVAIARALLRNPKILLLDEATSALDAESMHVVLKRL